MVALLLCYTCNISLPFNCLISLNVCYGTNSISPNTFKYTKFKDVNMQNPLSIRPSKEIEKKLEKLMDLEKTERPALIRRVLTTGIDEELKKCALQLFKDKKVSLAKAAEIADISIREMMDLTKEKGISLHITIEDIQEDFEAAVR